MATQSIAPAYAPTGSKTEWSGESGASGHPLMTSDAIRTAAANFPQCLERLWPEAARRGISRATYDAQTRGLTPDLKIMDLMDAQPEFTKAFWEYLDLLVSEDRIARGREILAQNRAAFDAMERAYGVDRHVITAIWGIESKYSTMIGDRPVVRSTATLACIGRRQDYFRNEFFAILELLNRGDVTAEMAKGSWAGAFGPTQFMPTVYKTYADRCRRRRPPRRDRLGAGSACLDRELFPQARLGKRTDLGLRSRGAAEFQFPARRPRQCEDRPRMGAARHHARGRQGISARQRSRVPDGAGRRAGAGLPDARQISA